jgi:hypothetical protein
MGPLLLLAALTLIPFVLMLALSLAAVAAGMILARALIHPARNHVLGGRTSTNIHQRPIGVPPRILDVEYEVKDNHEKG